MSSGVGCDRALIPEPPDPVRFTGRSIRGKRAVPGFNFRFTAGRFMILVVIASVSLAAFAYWQRLQRAAALKRAFAVHRQLLHDFEEATSEIKLAEANLKEARAQFEWSDRKERGGRLVFTSRDRDLRALERAHVKLDLAKTGQRILLYRRNYKDLKSLQQALNNSRQQVEELGGFPSALSRPAR